MPSTQAYTVDWTVEIQPEGDVSDDVADLTVTRQQDKPDAATIKLDTSQRPHALEEQRDVHIELTDGNDTITFDGFTDDVSDEVGEPIVTIDARQPSARMDDATLVHSVSKSNIWDVIDWIIDTGPSAIGELSYDAAAAKSKYGLFSGQVDFGSLELNYFQAYLGSSATSEAIWNDHEQIASGQRGVQAQIVIDNYTNTTGNTYAMDIEGEDRDGNVVTASLNLPPGSDVQEAFGTDTFKLSLFDGNRRWVDVDTISTDINVSSLGLTEYVTMDASIQNWVKTNYQYPVGEEISVREGLQSIVDYITTLDRSGPDWTYSVDPATNEVTVHPKSPSSPSTHTYTEGDNVIKPVAKRNIDGVKNYVKVSGQGGVNVWVWAYDGTFYANWGYESPHEKGIFPDDTSHQFLWNWKPSPANGVNDIDEIDLRPVEIESDQITGWNVALEVAQRTLDNRYRSSVSGTAPVTGVADVSIGDRAEVFYPSRGIPAMVADNTFTVEQVEHKVTPDEAKTEIDFGVDRPSAEEIIKKVVQSELASVFTPVAGTIQTVYDDDSAKVLGDDGQVYDNVEVV